MKRFAWPADVPQGESIPAVAWLRQVGLMAAKPTRQWRDRWKVYFDFRDWWSGLYISDEHLYFIVVPTLVFRWCRPNCEQHFEHVMELGHWVSVGPVDDYDYTADDLRPRR